MGWRDCCGTSLKEQNLTTEARSHGGKKGVFGTWYSALGILGSGKYEFCQIRQRRDQSQIPTTDYQILFFGFSLCLRGNSGFWLPGRREAPVHVLPNGRSLMFGRCYLLH
jgi:hypothetical protein